MSGGASEGRGSVNIDILADKQASVQSDATISGADIQPSTSIRGKSKSFEQKHQVKDKSGKNAEVYV